MQTSNNLILIFLRLVFLRERKKIIPYFLFSDTHKRFLNILLEKERLANADDRPLLKERTILLNTEFTVPQNRKVKVVDLIKKQHMQGSNDAYSRTFPVITCHTKAGQIPWIFHRYPQGEPSSPGQAGRWPLQPPNAGLP